MERKAVIVKALQEQYNIRQRIVNRQNSHSGQYTLEYRSKDVEEVACKPYRDEDDREAIC